jgi:nucleoside-diphosphate-sugar epimerase
MRVLMTGTEGYIGVVAAPLLAARGHEVVGVDTGFHRAGHLYRDGVERLPPTMLKDIRRLTAEDVAGFDAIVHMAELSNDPVGALSPTITYDINHRGSVRLAQLAKERGVERFVYTSSCSVYGVAGGTVDETAPVDPQTAYAECKAMVERDVGALAGDEFSPTFLRNATAFGASPRMRFDIVLNNLAGLAWTTGEIAMTSDGTPWRPLVHIEDISSAFIAALDAPRDAIHNEAFNIGRDEDNYQIRDVAQIVEETVPGSTISLASDAGPDKRSYRVSFGKVRQALPNFEPQWDVRRGAEQMRDAYQSEHLTLDSFTSSRFMRIKRIKELLADGQLGDDLRWVSSNGSGH